MVSSGETLCLRWNEFETNIKHGFSELRSNEDFFDVTVACGSRQIKAHRVILSACSSFFKSLLKSIPHEHPFLYLRGIDVKHLESLLCFMYNGEVRVEQEDLDAFLLVAQELQVNGLIQDQESSLRRSKKVELKKAEEEDSEECTLRRRPLESPSASSTSTKNEDEEDMKDAQSSPTVTISKLFPLREMNDVDVDNVSDGGNMHLGESSSGIDVPFVSMDASESLEDNMDDFDDEFDLNEPDYFTKSESEQSPVIDTQNSLRTNELLDAELLKCVSERDANNLFRCLKCSHTSRFKRDVKRHVEAKHLTTCFRCTKCFRIFKTRRSLSKHEMRMHRRTRFIISS